MNPVPSDKEMQEFRSKNLEPYSVEEIERKINQRSFAGWHLDEAKSFIQIHKEAHESKIKEESIEQARENNRLQKQGNKTARWALFVSILALVISLVAIFK